MVTVTLGPDGRTAPPDPEPVARLPRRFRLSRPAVEHLAARTDTPLPWERRPAPPATARLDAEPPAAAEPEPADPEGELRRSRLVTAAGDLEPEVAAAMAVFAAPEVLVDVDVSVRRAQAPAGFAQLHAWQRFRGGRVCSLSTAGGRMMELGWFDDDLWQVELARAVTVRAPTTRPSAPARVVDLPHELLLGSGEALRLHREDVLAELVRRHTGGVHADDDPAALGVADTGEQLRLLHGASVGRMRTVVAGVGATGARKAGWVSWLLFPDGWRALTPYVHAGEARVRVHPVEPLRLGVEVARLVTGVRA
ncbi:hypothetical protein GCM10009844_08850 [Nocardioides koreensis]|uniref:ESX secretion-associated protein EspG n=1 Tax=Nocardioides koreensis TaxID=433651 RepID=A0ABP5L2A8_9ACTN